MCHGSGSQIPERKTGDAALAAFGQEREKCVQTCDGFVAPEERHHFKKPRTGGSTGQCDPRGLDQGACLDPPIRCRSTHRRFHMLFIERTDRLQRMSQQRQVPGRVT